MFSEVHPFRHRGPASSDIAGCRGKTSTGKLAKYLYLPAQGEADATWIFTGWEGIDAQIKGVELNVFKLADYGIPYGYTPVLVALPETLRCNLVCRLCALRQLPKGVLLSQQRSLLEHPRQHVHAGMQGETRGCEGIPSSNLSGIPVCSRASSRGSAVSPGRDTRGHGQETSGGISGSRVKGVQTPSTLALFFQTSIAYRMWDTILRRMWEMSDVLDQSLLWIWAWCSTIWTLRGGGDTCVQIGGTSFWTGWVRRACSRAPCRRALLWRVSALHWTISGAEKLESKSPGPPSILQICLQMSSWPS
jgi:hypothetical protein